MNGNSRARLAGRKWTAGGGFSYLELVMVALILSLCTGLISETLALGVRHLRLRTMTSRAIILLDTLCGAARNDLFFAKAYHADGSFERATREGVYVRTWYGVGTWAANQPDNYKGVADWTEAREMEKGWIIRKSLVFSQEYYDLTAAPESYGTDAESLRAAIRIDPAYSADKATSFEVTIQIYGDSALLASKTFAVVPVQPIPVT